MCRNLHILYTKRKQGLKKTSAFVCYYQVFMPIIDL